MTVAPSYSLLIFGALASYLLGSLHLWYLALARGGGAKTTVSLAPIGATIHAAALVARTFAEGRPPFVGLHESFSFLSWAIVALFLALSTRLHLGSSGVFVLPAATISLFASTIVIREPVLDPLLNSPWLGFHASSSFLGDAAFVVTFGLSVLYLWKEQALKGKRLGRLSTRLPALETLDRLQYDVAWIGFSFLTLGMGSGLVWSFTVGTPISLLDPKVIATAVTWLIYGGILLLRLRARWGGKLQARTAIVGFAAALVTFLGASHFSSHRFL